MAAMQPEEVLKALVAATAEARTTTREMHEERKAIIEAVKSHHKRIDAEIVRQVDESVSALADDVRDEMRRRAGEVIDSLQQDWRDKLGLT